MRILTSTLIKNQVPQYILEQHPKFVEFLEAYYRFLEGGRFERNDDGVLIPSETGEITYEEYISSIDDTRDIDESLFIDQFKRELAEYLPDDVAVDERFLYQNIKDLYLSKGSEESYKLLFKLLYNKDIEISYPKERLLIPSDGRWVQEQSIFITTTDSLPDDLENFDIKVLGKDINISIGKYRERGTNVYECFFDTINGQISSGDTINITTDSGVIDGVIEKTSSSLDIKSSNGVFVEGEVLPIIHDGSESIQDIIITEVDQNGNVIHVKLLNNIKRDGDDIELTRDYNGREIVFIYHVGVVAKYPGYYTNTNSQASSNNFIQDSYYYQLYSYVIKVDLFLQQYKYVLRDVLHPAGMKLFGDYEISSEYDLEDYTLSGVEGRVRTINLVGDRGEKIKVTSIGDVDNIIPRFHHDYEDDSDVKDLGYVYRNIYFSFTPGEGYYCQTEDGDPYCYDERVDFNQNEEEV